MRGLEGGELPQAGSEPGLEEESPAFAVTVEEPLEGAHPARARGRAGLERLSRAEDGRIAYRMKRAKGQPVWRTVVDVQVSDSFFNGGRRDSAYVPHRQASARDMLLAVRTAGTRWRWRCSAPEVHSREGVRPRVGAA